jgi:hypothetical protein
VCGRSRQASTRMLLVTMFVALSDFAALPSLLSLRVLAECASWV